MNPTQLIASQGQSALPAIIDHYDQMISDAQQRLSFDGKTLAECLREQSGLTYEFEVAKARLKHVVEYTELLALRVRGGLVRKYTEQYTRALGERAINAYIDNEDSFISANALHLEVKELYDTVSAICEAISRRGFALKNLTDLHVNHLQHVVME